MWEKSEQSGRLKFVSRSTGLSFKAIHEYYVLSCTFIRYRSQKVTNLPFSLHFHFLAKIKAFLALTFSTPRVAASSSKTGISLVADIAASADSHLSLMPGAEAQLHTPAAGSNTSVAGWQDCVREVGRVQAAALTL